MASFHILSAGAAQFAVCSRIALAVDSPHGGFAACFDVVSNSRSKLLAGDPADVVIYPGRSSILIGSGHLISGSDMCQGVVATGVAARFGVSP